MNGWVGGWLLVAWPGFLVTDWNCGGDDFGYKSVYTGIWKRANSTQMKAKEWDEEETIRNQGRIGTWYLFSM